jgi:hypothetical protein
MKMKKIESRSLIAGPYASLSKFLLDQFRVPAAATAPEETLYA